MGLEEPIVRSVALILFVGGMSWLVSIGRRAHRNSGGGPLSRLRAAWGVAPGAMRCREAVRLTPQHSVHLIEYGRRRYLVACHPGGTTLLSGEAVELVSEEAAHV